jgi:hypothetical protein
VAGGSPNAPWTLYDDGRMRLLPADSVCATRTCRTSERVPVAVLRGVHALLYEIQNN